MKWHASKPIGTGSQGGHSRNWTKSSAAHAVSFKELVLHPIKDLERGGKSNPGVRTGLQAASSTRATSPRSGSILPWCSVIATWSGAPRSRATRPG